METDEADQRERMRTLQVSIVRSSHSAIATTDLAGTVTSWNPGAERLYGYAERDMLGQSVDKVIPRERRNDEAELRELVRLGGRVETHRTRRVHAEGREFPVTLMVSPLRDENDEIIGITTTVRDVTEREKAEAQVRAILDAAHDPLLGVDRAGTVVLVNAAAERMFGLSRYELLHRNVDHLLVGGLPDLDAQPGWIVGEAVVSGGHRIPVEISCSVLDTDGGQLVIAVVRDITARLAAQAEQDRLRAEAERQKIEARLQRAQRLESLGQLAGGIAHDFNNLLAVILNYATFIVEDGAGTPFAADAEQITRAGTRGTDLTRQLLAFARREKVQPRPLDVNTVVAEVSAMLSRSIGENIRLRTPGSDPLPSVLADPGQLEQVLVNLAVNARDAMPSGGELTIDTGCVDVDDAYGWRTSLDPGRYVRVRVSDTGTGMPPEVIEKAFDPFFTTKPGGQGTGLGLATVYGIMTQAGGTVQIYSEPGLGTTITLLLPATEDCPPCDEQAAAEPQPGGGGATVLLVEDEDALREVTGRLLGRHEYRVLTARDGAEALEVLRTHGGRVDVLLSDVVMPGMPGRALAEAVRAERPDTPVLFMSGYAQPVLAAQGALPTEVHLLEKPFTSAQLLRALRRHLPSNRRLP